MGSTVVLVAVLLAVTAFTFPAAVGTDHSYVVLSSSMEPAIDAGDAVFVRDVPAARIEVGDVITFRRQVGAANADSVTHRVVEVVERDDGRYFRTKGDNLEEADETLVPAESVVGRVVFHLPYVGYVLSAAGTDPGIVAFLVVPSLLLLATELRVVIAWWRNEDTGGET